MALPTAWGALGTGERRWVATCVGVSCAEYGALAWRVARPGGMLVLSEQARPIATNLAHCLGLHPRVQHTCGTSS